MSSALALDLLGYVAAAFIAFGLTRTSVLKLRLLNLVGGLTFIAYGFLIDSMPVALTNIVISVINLYFLTKLLRHKEIYSLLEVDPDSSYLLEFLRFHADEIRRFMPGFTYVGAHDQLRLFILRDMLPVGLFIGDERGDGSMAVRLDYATPGYRDFGIGKFLYSSATEPFAGRGIGTLVSPPGESAHEKYLKRVGYVKSGDSYVKEL
jgi:hypothetical protein